MLVLLWGQRDHLKCPYLLGLMLDCYALTVSMRCRDVLVLWKQHVTQARIHQQSKQNLLGMLSQRRSEDKREKRGGF